MTWRALYDLSLEYASRCDLRRRQAALSAKTLPHGKMTGAAGLAAHLGWPTRLLLEERIIVADALAGLGRAHVQPTRS